MPAVFVVIVMHLVCGHTHVPEGRAGGGRTGRAAAAAWMSVVLAAATASTSSLVACVLVASLSSCCLACALCLCVCVVGKGLRDKERRKQDRVVVSNKSKHSPPKLSISNSPHISHRTPKTGHTSKATTPLLCFLTAATHAGACPVVQPPLPSSSLQQQQHRSTTLNSNLP